MRDINSLNKVILVGRLGQKPEMFRMPQQDRWKASFTLATNERLFNPNTRESSDRTEWHNIVVYGKLAEFCEKYLTQGRQILLEGKLRTRSWQDKESGNKRYKTEVEATSITLLGKREEGSATTTDTTDLDAVYGRGGGAGRGPAAGGEEFPSGEESGGGSGGPDDDIPF
jgi:single-strand DNA-binding protein